MLVASVAYAVGSQAGGGSAGAATKPVAASLTSPSGTTGATGPGMHAGRHGGRGLGSMLTEAASALGVSEAKLRTALQELRPPRDQRGDRRDELATALASSLGVDAAAVTKALDAQRPARPDRTERFGAPAKELGRRGHRGPGHRGPDHGGPDHGGPGHGGPGHHGGGPGVDAAALAKALSVDEAKVTAALADFRAARQKEHEALRATLIKQLAVKLGVSEAKVTEVAERFLPRGGHGRP